MSNGNIPDPTPGIPWYQDGRFIAFFAMMLLGFAGNQITGCQAYYKSSDANNHAAAAKNQSEVNAAKSEEIEKKVGALERTTDRIEDKAGKIGAKVGASGNGK